MVDAAAGDTLMRKTSKNAYQLLEEMTLNAYQWQSKRPIKRIQRINNIDTISALSTKIEVFSKKMDNLNASAMLVQAFTCNLYEGAHANIYCHVGNSFAHSFDQANFVGNFQG